jgi:phosphoribosylformylglycinamidine synthase
MAQLSAAIDGIAEACTALGTPITGGNVSLYNETRGEGIYPTPVLGIVGILDDVTKAVPADFQKAGDAILLLWPIPKGKDPDPSLKVPFRPEPMKYYPVEIEANEPVANEDPDTPEETATTDLAAFGASEFAHVVLGGLWGQPPALDLDAEADLHTLLHVLAKQKLLRSARDISDGGIAVALAQAGFPKGIGATVEQEQSLMVHPLFGLFAEPPSTLLVTAHPDNVSKIETLAGDYSFFVARIGTTGGTRLEISVEREPFISAPLEDLRKPWKPLSTARFWHEPVALSGSRRGSGPVD